MAMGRVAANLLMIAALISACAGGPRPSRPIWKDSHILMGPEAFRFCGGWLEIWAQIDRITKDSVFYVKASPPNGKTWRVGPRDFSVRHPSEPRRRLDLGRSTYSVTLDGETENLLSWEMERSETPVAGRLYAAVRGFPGCSGDGEIRDVVLIRAEDL